MYILKGEHQEIDPQACGQKQFRLSGGRWGFPAVIFEKFEQNIFFTFLEKSRRYLPAVSVEMILNEKNRK